MIRPFDSTKKYSIVAPFRNVLLARILLGLYNGYFRLVLVGCFARIYCLIVPTVISLCLMTQPGKTFYRYTCVAIIQWLFNVVFSFSTGEKYFLCFCEEIKKIDVKLKHPNLTLDPSISRRIFTMLLLLKSILTIILSGAHVFGYNQCYISMNYFALSYIWMALQLSHMTQLIIFEISSHRVKLLRKFMENYLDNACPKRQYNVNQKTKVIKEAILIYKCICETLQKTNTPVKLLVTIALCFNFFKASAHCYDALSVDNIHHRIVVALMALEHGISCAMCCLPTLFAEKAEQELNRMKMILTDELLICNDADLQMVIQDATDYLTFRPLDAIIRRVFSFDMNLPLTFFNLYITYIVVIVKITNIA